MGREGVDLVKAFGRFTPDRDRFLKDFAAASGLKLIRFAPKTEYEVKFSAKRKKVTPIQLLRRVRASLRNSNDWVRTEHHARTIRKPDYFTKGSVEYSTYVDGGRPAQKIKDHQRLDVDGIPIMKSREAHTTDSAQIIRNIGGAQYFGTLRKDRVKTYLLHVPSRTAHSLCVTKYTVGKQTRIQCEIEYVGHLFKRGEHIPSVHESALVHLMSKVARSILTLNRGTLRVESETKLEFLMRSTAQARAVVAE
jgi:hypothetical protein